MSSRYPGAKWRPVVNHSGPMAAHDGLILHVAEAPGSVHDWFNNPQAQASSTFWVDTDGLVEQYVDADEIAWAQAAGNSVYNSVETAGYATTALTKEQVQAVAKLYVWGHKKYGWPLQLAEKPGDKGLGWHGMGGTAWGGHFGCPGDIRKAQRSQILRLAQSLLAPAPAPVPVKMTKRQFIGWISRYWPFRKR